MITKDLQLRIFAIRTLNKSSSKNIKNTWLEKYWSFLIVFSDSFNNSTIGRKEIFIITLSWEYHISWIFEQISPDRLIQKLIPQKIRLI
jgi:hypothetical protein